MLDEQRGEKGEQAKLGTTISCCAMDQKKKKKELPLLITKRKEEKKKKRGPHTNNDIRLLTPEKREKKGKTKKTERRGKKRKERKRGRLSGAEKGTVPFFSGRNGVREEMQKWDDQRQDRLMQGERKKKARQMAIRKRRRGAYIFRGKEGGRKMKYAEAFINRREIKRGPLAFFPGGGGGKELKETRILRLPLKSPVMFHSFIGERRKKTKISSEKKEVPAVHFLFFEGRKKKMSPLAIARRKWGKVRKKVDGFRRYRAKQKKEGKRLCAPVKQGGEGGGIVLSFSQSRGKKEEEGQSEENSPVRKGTGGRKRIVAILELREDSPSNNKKKRGGNRFIGGVLQKRGGEEIRRRGGRTKAGQKPRVPKRNNHRERLGRKRKEGEKRQFPIKKKKNEFSGLESTKKEEMQRGRARYQRVDARLRQKEKEGPLKKKEKKATRNKEEGKVDPMFIH